MLSTIKTHASYNLILNLYEACVYIWFIIQFATQKVWIYSQFWQSKYKLNSILSRIFYYRNRQKLPACLFAQKEAQTNIISYLSEAYTHSVCQTCYISFFVHLYLEHHFYSSAQVQTIFHSNGRPSLFPGSSFFWYLQNLDYQPSLTKEIKFGNRWLAYRSGRHF